jgi:hypothetical protein
VLLLPTALALELVLVLLAVGHGGAFEYGPASSKCVPRARGLRVSILRGWAHRLMFILGLLPFSP